MHAWDQFLEGLKKTRSPGFLDPWISGFHVVLFDAQNLYLEAKDPFHMSWFEEHLRPHVRQSLRNNNNRLIKVHVDLKKDPHATSTAILPKKALEPPFEMPSLDRSKTFKSFVSEKSNLLILQLLQDIKGSSTASFNPIYLWGPSGSGKTHLLMATCLALEEQGLKVLYTHATAFTEQVVQAIRSSSMQEFRAFYRGIDVLVMDDIHLFAKKTATQEEFFHTFNTLHTAGKSVVISSALAPYDLKEIEPRLISRFEWGISLGLEPLSLEEMQKALENKLKAFELLLAEGAKQFLYKQFGDSMEKFGKALDTLTLRSHLEKIPPAEKLSLEKTTMFLQQLLKAEQRAKLSPEIIIDAVASGFNRKSKELLGKSQTKECALPRQVSMYFLREELSLAFKKIGEIFGRDHSTVMSSVRLIQEKMGQRSEDIFEIAKEIKEKLSVFEKEKASL